MTIDKDRSFSPVHLHVDEAIPVHVHVKKPNKKSHEGSAVVNKTKPASRGASNLRRSTASSRSPDRRSARSPERRSTRSPERGPWVPPPGKATKTPKVSWQGASHRLEITGPDGADIQTSLRLSDLSTDEEDQVQSQMRQYEKKIDGLMTEVGSLKNEVELQRSRREVEQREDELDTSRRALHQQEQALDDVKRELKLSEAENDVLRVRSRSLSPGRTRLSPSQLETQTLLKKLLDVEVDGQAATKEAAALKDSIKKIKQDKRAGIDCGMISKQKDTLIDKLTTFERTNRCLRELLQARHDVELGNLRLMEQRDLLIAKLTEQEATVQALHGDVLERDRQLSEFRLSISSQKEESVAMAGLQSSLESTRAHLQKQLRQKEGDCNRMAVQIRTMETALAQERIEVDHLQGLLRSAKEKAERDKEALKKATRVQKQRACRSEDAMEGLNAQIMERDNLMSEMRQEVDNMAANCDMLGKEKTHIYAENSALNTRISELESALSRLEESCQQDIETATARLKDKTSESTALALENSRVKKSVSAVEEKLAAAEAEVAQLRTGLKQYETLVDEYRAQVNRSRREADDTIVQLDDQKRETTRVKKTSEEELEKVKERLQKRLLELEPIPELLKSTELKLHEAGQQVLDYERRHSEHTRLIVELTAKVERQCEDGDTLRARLHHVQDDSLGVHAHAEVMERKVRELEDQLRDLLQTCAKREESVHQLQCRLDEKTSENNTLAQKLEGALSDSRKIAETNRDKTAAKERTVQARMLELESQMTALHSENARLKREKDEVERKSNSKLYDMKDRLEQSHSTNRSMQNYVQFLKNSYANVFGESPACNLSMAKPAGGGMFPY